MKICKHCHEPKPFSEFKTKKNGVMFKSCKTCLEKLYESKKVMCPQCNQTKLLKDFPSDTGTESGKKKICKQCFNEYQRNRYIKKVKPEKKSKTSFNPLFDVALAQRFLGVQSRHLKNGAYLC